MIQHGLNGWLVEAAAEEKTQQRSLEQALQTLMGDASLRARLGQAALAVRERFAVTGVRQQLLKAVEGCLEPRVLVFAPTRRSPTETFVRANLARLPLPQIAYFGDEFGFGQTCRCSADRASGPMAVRCCSARSAPAWAGSGWRPCCHPWWPGG